LDRIRAARKGPALPPKDAAPIRDTSVNRTSSIPCIAGTVHHWKINDALMGLCKNCGAGHQFVHEVGQQVELHASPWDVQGWAANPQRVANID